VVPATLAAQASACSPRSARTRGQSARSAASDNGASRVAAGAVDGAVAGAAERATAHHPATTASTRAAAVVVLRIRRCWFMVITNHFAAAPAPAEAPEAAGAGISFASTAHSTNRCGQVPNGIPLRGVIEPPWPPVP